MDYTRQYSYTYHGIYGVAAASTMLQNTALLAIIIQLCETALV